VAGAQRRAASAVDQVPGDRRPSLRGDVRGAIAGAVVDDQGGGLEPTDLGRNPVEDVTDAVGLVVGRDQDADLVAESLRIAGFRELFPRESLEHRRELTGDPRAL